MCPATSKAAASARPNWPEAKRDVPGGPAREEALAVADRERLRRRVDARDGSSARLIKGAAAASCLPNAATEVPDRFGSPGRQDRGSQHARPAPGAGCCSITPVSPPGRAASSPLVAWTSEPANGCVPGQILCHSRARRSGNALIYRPKVRDGTLRTQNLCGNGRIYRRTILINL